MNSLYPDSIARVKSLYSGFSDVIHDWDHSQRVASNANHIADSIGFGDKEFLELCALWHDAARTKGVTDGHEEAGALMARTDLLENGADEEIAKKIYNAIRFHKSSASPVTIEGKIIRDADKLDIFAVVRWEKCANAGWTKEYADDLRKSVASYSKYPDAFTFDYTKEQFKKVLPKFLSFYESVKDQLPDESE